MEKKITFRYAMKKHLRALKELHKIGPRLFPVYALHAGAEALLPYVTVFFSAAILRELALLRRPEVLWKWVAASVLTTGLLAIAKVFLNQRKETLLSDIWGRKEILFIRKAFSMDYADLDKQETHDLRQQIQQNERFSSWGIMRATYIFHDALEASWVFSAALRLP